MNEIYLQQTVIYINLDNFGGKKFEIIKIKNFRYFFISFFHSFIVIVHMV